MIYESRSGDCRAVSSNFLCSRNLRKFSVAVGETSSYNRRRAVMNQRILAEIGRTQRLEILNSLKRSKGMSVNELVRKMKMSYMGIKQHCLTLQRDGYLDTW